jgi:hypothetical protein
MTYAWTVKDSSGALLPHFVCNSRLEVGRKIVPAHFDAFRLHVSSSYREVFDRALTQALEKQGWRIVRTRISQAVPRQGRSLPSA